MKLHFSPKFLQLLQKIKLSVKFRGWGRLNFDGELLPIIFSDFMFNLPKVYLDNASNVSVSSVGVLFPNLFWFNEMGCLK